MRDSIGEWICGDDLRIEANGTVSGGTLCTRRLRDAARVVPDIHTVFGGGLHVFCETQFLELPADTAATNDATHARRVRDALLDDYARKDALVAHFDQHRTFPHVSSADDWAPLPVPHIAMNLTILAYLAIGVAATQLALWIDTLAALVLIATVWASLIGLHAISHMLGVAISGYDRESLPGESAFKAGFEYVNSGLNHGSRSHLCAEGEKNGEGV